MTSSCILYKWWNEIIHTFPNFSLGLNKLFHPHFTRHVITYQCWDYSKSMSVHRGPPQYKDIVLSLTWEPRTWKDALYIETGPRMLHKFIVALWQHGGMYRGHHWFNSCIIGYSASSHCPNQWRYIWYIEIFLIYILQSRIPFELCASLFRF